LADGVGVLAWHMLRCFRVAIVLLFAVEAVVQSGHGCGTRPSFLSFHKQFILFSFQLSLVCFKASIRSLSQVEQP
jgi:hypothetical protein